LPGGQPPRQPGPHRGVERASVDPLQGPGGWWPHQGLESPGERIATDTERTQDLRRRIGGPFADRANDRPGRVQERGQPEKRRLITRQYIDAHPASL